MFSLGFIVSEEEILRESLARDEEMVDITRDILARTKNAEALELSLDHFLKCQTVMYLPERRLTTATALFTTKVLFLQVVHI